MQMGTEAVKLALFEDNMIAYIENPKYIIKNVLELINEFSKISNTKSIHRSHLHFYILTMKNQKEKLKIPLTIATE